MSAPNLNTVGIYGEPVMFVVKRVKADHSQ